MIPYLSALYDNALCSDGGMTKIIRSRAEEGLGMVTCQVSKQRSAVGKVAQGSIKGEGPNVETSVAVS